MTTTPHVVPDVGDAELISSVRGGDTAAYATLYERHVDAARRLARQLVTPADAEDLVAEAFTKVLVVLQRGGGPDVAFRAYLLTSIRRLHVDRIRATAKVQTTDDLTPFEPGIPFVDTAVEGFDNLAAAEAFRSLPERWQVVLWHTEVEGQKPADIAPMLGMTPNSVAALAYRAREGLRQAFLSQHAADIEDDTCRWTQQHLGGFVREGLSRRDHTKVQSHLDECRRCMGIYLELVEVNSGLAALLAPLLLGGSLGAAYLASATTGAVGGAVGAGFLSGLSKGVVAGADRAKDLVAANVGLSVAASVAAVAAVSGLAVAGANLVGGSDAPPVAVSDASPFPSADNSAPARIPSPQAASSSPASRAPQVAVALTPHNPVVAIVPVATPTSSPTSAPTSAPTAAPTSTPTEQPTTAPTDTPSSPATSGPTETATTTPTPTTEPTPSTPPTPSPSASATPTATTTPTPSPTAPETTLPTGNPALGFAVTQQYYVDAQLNGLPRGAQAVVTISFTGIGYVATGDTRCSSTVMLNGQSITCTVTDTTPIVLNTVLATAGSTLSANATVTGVEGDDTADNSAQHTITNARPN